MSAASTRKIWRDASEPRHALPEGALDGVAHALRTVRSHLDMDVAFVSEFVGPDRVFRHVDSKGHRRPIRKGDVIPLEDGYCAKIVRGELPELIPDTACVPEAMAIPETHSVPIGAHISVPLRLSDGRIYGTFCCFSFHSDTTLNERDLAMLRAFADLIAHQIDGDIETNRRRSERERRIANVLASNEPSMVFQPIFHLADMRIVGAESLARFKIEPYQTPDIWFSEAASVGRRTELELKAIRRAIGEFLPIARNSAIGLGLNASPETIMSGELTSLLASIPAGMVVLEITEHDVVEDYVPLNAAIWNLRNMGITIAVDDAGSGYASMRHILNIRPNYIKLDISLTREIASDRMKQALAAALIEFGRQTDCRVVAEGVETEDEMRILRDLGVDGAQGFHLARPCSSETFGELLCRTNGVVPVS